MKNRLTVYLVSLLLIIMFTGCSFSFDDGSGNNATNLALQQTQMAMAIQGTSLALQQTQIALDSNQAAQPQQPVVQQQEVQPTYTPYPTYTPQVVEVQQAPTEEYVAPVVAIEPYEDWVKSTKILVYNDMYGIPGSEKMVENALDAAGLGGNVTLDKDAMGYFLSHLNSSTIWDLIIVVSERRGAISGEYFDVINQQIDRGSSVIMEVWYLDDVINGKVAPIMQKCGMTLHRDWWRDWNANLNDYLVYLVQPDNPIFSDPNPISMLIPRGSPMWTGDVGDLLKSTGGGDGQIVAATQPKEKTAYGTLGYCMDGRIIIQTFSTHDYKTIDMTNLWQNYIVNALKARYNFLAAQ